MQESNNRSKKKLWLVICIIIAAIVVAAAIFIARYIYISQTEKYEYNALLEEVVGADYDERQGDAVTLPDGLDYTNHNIDFDKLKEYNNEIIGWIYVPNTQVDYPIARHENDADLDYYLYHDMYQEPAYAGCIYVDYANSGDFTDNNTVLYGHNMANDTMFGSLHDFEDETFFNENEYFYIYTPDASYKYHIFAAYQTDNTKLTSAYDFSDEQVYAKYLEDIWNIRTMRCNLREDVELSVSDKIVTLSTCVGSAPDNRYLVQGVLVEDE